METPTALQFVSATRLEPSIRVESPSIGSLFQAPTLNIPDRLRILQIAFGDSFTLDQYNAILSINYVNSTTPVYDLDDSDSYTEINALLLSVLEQPPERTFDQVLQVLYKVAANPNEDMVWGMPSVDPIRAQVDRDYEISIEKPEGSSYKGRCKNKGCTSENFETTSNQTRGWDEGATYYVTCLKCGTKFRI
jgi:DNA-directed RNA polymerase subunit M/transcription elongation factor TFIIS